MNDLQKNLDWAYKNLELMTVENMIKEIEKLENMALRLQDTTEENLNPANDKDLKKINTIERFVESENFLENIWFDIDLLKISINNLSKEIDNLSTIQIQKKPEYIKLVYGDDLPIHQIQEYHNEK